MEQKLAYPSNISLGIFDDFFLFIERICMKAISKIVNREFMQPELLLCKQNSIVFFQPRHNNLN
jgi:hypothetical protein